MKSQLFATVMCAAALLIASPTIASASSAPSAVVPSASDNYGIYVEKPVEGFFPNLNICNAERLSFRSQGFWTGGCFYSATNRGWGFYYS